MPLCEVLCGKDSSYKTRPPLQTVDRLLTLWFGILNVNKMESGQQLFIRSTCDRKINVFGS